MSESNEQVYPEIGGWPITRQAYKADPYDVLNRILREHAGPKLRVLDLFCGGGGAAG